MAGERRGGAGPAAAPPAVPLAARAQHVVPRPPFPARAEQAEPRGHRRRGERFLSLRQAECLVTAGAPSPAPRMGRAVLRDGEAVMSWC